MKPRVLAIAAHPDDIEIFMAGTLLRLAEAGWELHYFNLSCGNGGSLEMDGETTARVRLEEAGAQGHEHELALVYPHEADGSAEKVSILAPVGSALLGLRVGDAID